MTAFVTLVIIAVIGYKLWPIISIFVYGDVRLNKSSQITDEQYKQLALGAPYASQQMAYQNSLTLGIGSKLHKIAHEWWGIDSRETAIGMLDYLVAGGYRQYFPEVSQALLKKTLEEQENYLKDNIKDEEALYKASTYLKNLRSCVVELIREKVVESKEDIAKNTATAWDMGRIVFVARMSYDMKYISEAEAWTYIAEAYKIAKKEFKAWKDYGNSYVIGRAMWGGSTCENGGMIVIVNSILENENSPWKKFEI